MKKSYWLGLLLIPFILFGCLPDEEHQKNLDSEVVQTSGIEQIATNLNIPWSIDYDGQAFYISERTGTIVKVEDNDVERQKVFLKMPLSKAEEAGLLGFVLHPTDVNRAFAYYTYENSDGQYNRVIELVLKESGWLEERELLDKIPSGNVHHGGRIKIGPDGKLYVTTGDAATPALAQDLTSLAGKILRLNLDGSIPDDNPIKGTYIFSYGHRNPQGLAWDGNRKLYSSEHGASAHDEINLIVPGANYGWPVIQGNEKKGNMELPLFHSSSTTWAPSGIAFHNDMLYVAQLRGEGIRAFDLENKTHKQVVSGFGRVRDIFIIDNALYFITNNTDGRGQPGPKDDRLLKLTLTEDF